MRLGQQVLNKIQNLLADIGQSKQRTPRPPIKKHNQQNINENSVYDKLYQMHRAKKVKNQCKQRQKFIKQQQQLSPFKVTNKHSIFINSQTNSKPIHQRLHEIKRNQIQQLQRLKQKYPNKQADIDDEQQRTALEMENRRRNEKKYTKKQLQQKMKQMENRQKLRMQKLNRLKIKAIENHSKQFRCKPYIGKESQNVWNRYKLKKDLSNSVFQRFQQYQIDRRVNLEHKQRQIRQKMTPFAPKISQNSKIMASRSASKSDLHKPFSRSLSCRCFQKGKYLMNRQATMTSSRLI